MSFSPPLLGVEHSLSGRIWRKRSFDPKTAQAMSQRFELSSVVSEILAARHVPLDGVEEYLSPKIKQFMPAPCVVQDMEKGALRLQKAILSREKIGIISDYDVDGMASAALLKKFLDAVSAESIVYFPDRLKHGYGPNREAVENLHAQGVRLLVTLDCGISAHDPLEYACQKGLDVLVVDHHLASPTLPPAHAIINPNRCDDVSGLGYLCAAGVVFFWIATTHKFLREHTHHYREINPLLWLDLVALATICDVVPLVGLNRAYVQQGIKLLAQRSHPGIAALCDCAGLRRAPDSHALGYTIGPRLNAAGRMGSAALGFELLTCRDPYKASLLASRLDTLNQVRQSVESTTFEAATLSLEKNWHVRGEKSVSIIWGEDWHPGVLGLLASRLVEKYRKPAFVFGGLSGVTRLTGSARSIPGINLGEIVKKAHASGLLLKGGGHAMAAGMTLDLTSWEAFQHFVEDSCEKAFQKREQDQLLCDGLLQVSAVTSDFISLFERAGPFGQGNPAPIFVFPSHQITYATCVGHDHVRCTLRQEDGKSLQAMAFRAASSPLGTRLLEERNTPLHLAGRLSINDWNGKRTPQLLIEDGAEILQK